MSDDVWIIGTSMTPIRRHLDRDVVDLAVDASLGALGDADVTMQDMQVMAVGSQFEPFTFGQLVQKQIGQTGIPLYNVHNACATGATGDGAAAVVLVSGAKLRTLDPDVRRRAVKVSAAIMTTDPYTPSGHAHPDVNTLTRMAADQAYERAGVDPSDHPAMADAADAACPRRSDGGRGNASQR